MKIVYNGPSPSVTANGFYAERGVPVEVPAGLAHALLEQDTFSEVSKKKADPAAEDAAKPQEEV